VLEGARRVAQQRPHAAETLTQPHVVRRARHQGLQERGRPGRIADLIDGDLEEWSA